MERMESRWGKQGKNREVSLRGPYNASFDAFDLPIVETGNTGPCGGEIVLRASSVAFIKRPADDAGDALLAVDSVDGADVNDPAIGVQLDFVPCEAPRR
jgi:hypothetical protein